MLFYCIFVSGLQLLLEAVLSDIRPIIIIIIIIITPPG